MNQNNEPSFMDRGTIVAIVLAMLVFWGWSHYMNSKYPQTPATAEQKASTEEATKSADSAAPAATAPADATQAAKSETPASTEAAGAAMAAPEIAPETFVNYQSENLSFEISSKGMGLRNIQIGQYQTRDGKAIMIGSNEGNYPFATSFAGSGKLIDFTVEKTGENSFLGRATVDGLAIEKTIEIDPVTYSFKSSVNVAGANDSFGGLATTVSDAIHETKSGSFLVPSYDFQDWYVGHDGTKTREVISKEEGNQIAIPNAIVVALSAHYFTIAAADHSDLIPKFEAKNAPGASTSVGKLIYQPVNRNQTFAIKYTGYVGPKSLSILSQVDESLTNVIDFGMFAFIGKPILNFLRYLHTIIGNWGWAIVVLTIIVRILVLPFNIYSMKSMKAMQKVQPEMNRIREKYKDKPADQKMQMNQEIMQLMKESKANPLGGCLPMLLQLPVFFALYQVLGQSIELYRAPFMFWIHDLSAMDPYFVLPILMGITMFVQQKITPTTMDPQQAKIMLWMPVIFSFFMISLPSGLTLYIFVSTLFGVIQQYILMRDSTPVHTVKEAKA